MINKVVTDLRAAVADIADGSTVMVSGFGDVGLPHDLVAALADQGARNLTVVSNNAGVGDQGIGALLRNNQVRKVVCSFPRSRGSVWFERRYQAGDVELELVPQGTLSERIRAAGAGIRAFYTKAGVGTVFAEGKESRIFGTDEYLLEEPIQADFALIRANTADRWANLVYRKAARNFGPTMAAAARVTIAEVDRIVSLGELDPEIVVTPGIYVDRVVLTGQRND